MIGENGIPCPKCGTPMGLFITPIVRRDALGELISPKMRTLSCPKCFHSLHEKQTYEDYKKECHMRDALIYKDCING